jgi:hypothetical protein
MILGWNEIKSRAFAFCKEWEGTEREEAEAKPFLIEFLNIFGITRKRVSTFEHKVKKLGNTDGYIDLLWKGTLLVEMKSKGKDLDKAYTQAPNPGTTEFLVLIVPISDPTIGNTNIACSCSF